jgi:hypothetical protein
MPVLHEMEVRAAATWHRSSALAEKVGNVCIEGTNGIRTKAGKSLKKSVNIHSWRPHLGIAVLDSMGFPTKHVSLKRAQKIIIIDCNRQVESNLG